MTGVAYAVPDFFLTAAGWLPGPTAIFTRSNDVVAYGLGQVYGDPADARLSFATPALPAGSWAPGFNNMFFTLIQTRDPTGAAMTLNAYARPGGFTTVLADHAPLALSDPDIAALAWIGTPAPGVSAGNFPAGTGPTMLTMGAGLAGRRGVGFLFATQNGVYLPPSSTVGLYFTASAAYTPLALEQLLVRSFFAFRLRGR
jgi:hypothetical protein